jgi:hypothetical protein
MVHTIGLFFRRLQDYGDVSLVCGTADDILILRGVGKPED